MEQPQISQDDLMDVVEMTERLEMLMKSIFEDNEQELALSAVMSATINCMIAQSKTKEMVVFHRNVFMQIFDSSIKSIQIKGPDKPLS